MKQLLPSLNDDARLWIWVAQRPLATDEQAAITGAVAEFLSTWETHGRPIRGEAVILLDQVVVLGGEVEEGDISGCGIDKSAHLLERAGRAHGFEWCSGVDVPTLVATGGPVRITARNELRHAISQGRISEDDLIVDRSLSRLGDARSAGLCRCVKDTWAARYVSAGSTATG